MLLDKINDFFNSTIIDESVCKATFLKELYDTVTANILSVLIGTLTSIIIARVLGPEMRGEFAIITVWSSVFANLASFGINDGVGYFVGINKNRNIHYLQTGLAVVGFFSIILCFPSVLMIKYLMKTFSKEVTYAGMCTVGISLFLIPQFMLIQSYLQGKGLIKQLNIINILSTIIYFFMVIFAWIVSPRLNNVLILIILAYLLTYGILDIAVIINLFKGTRKYKDKLDRAYLFIDFKEAKRLFSYGLSANLANMVNLLSAKLDQIFLSFLAEPISIGLYAISLNMMAPFSSIGNAVSTLALPMITSAVGIRKKSEIISKLYISYFYSIIPPILVVASLSKYIIISIFGKEYIGASEISRVILISSIFIGANQLGISILKAVGSPIKALICRVICLIILIISLNFLIARFNIIGAGIAVLISNFISSGITVILIKKASNLKVMDIIIPRKAYVKNLIERLHGLAKFLRK